MESLVVIVIVAVIAGLLLPELARSKDSAKVESCIERMLQVHIADQMYRADYDEKGFIAMKWGSSRPVDSTQISAQVYEDGRWGTGPVATYHAYKFGEEPWPPTFE